MQEKILTGTSADLTAALQEWDKEAVAKGFKQRTDDRRFEDTANYLIGKIEARVARRHAD